MRQRLLSAIAFLLLVSLSGCMTVSIPKYIRDEHPYERKYFASFDDTLKVTVQALEQTGWRIANMSNPETFEKGQAYQEAGAQQVLIFTEARQTPLILSSRYMSLNVYLRALPDKSTQIEIRYLGVTPVLFKNIQRYRHDAVVNKIFAQISHALES